MKKAPFKSPKNFSALMPNIGCATSDPMVAPAIKVSVCTQSGASACKGTAGALVNK